MSATDVALVAIHGTGTPLGDPIEAGALGQALGGGGRKQLTRPLAALSNKACYGHTEGTAGLTGLLLAVQVRNYFFSLIISDVYSTVARHIQDV